MVRVLTQTFGVVGAIIEKGGKILLVKEHHPGWHDHGKWNHPAGWLEVGENPIEAAKREVREETGLEFIPTHLLGIYSLVRKDLEKETKATPHPVKLIFTGKVNPRAKHDLHWDVSETKWFSPSEIYKMDKKALRDLDIKQMVRDYLSGKRYPLGILRHTVSR
jgi:phosphatase NudJ